VNCAADSETALPLCGATGTRNAVAQDWWTFFLGLRFLGRRRLAPLDEMFARCDACSVPGEPVVLVAGEDGPSPADGDSDGDELVEVLVDGLGLLVEFDGVGDGETDSLDDGVLDGAPDDLSGGQLSPLLPGLLLLLSALG
jgi:hypothetical protein